MKTDSALTVGLLLNFLIGRSVSNFPLMSKVPWFLYGLVLSFVVAWFVALSDEAEEQIFRMKVKRFLNG